ncbi:MAG: excinuclease ABC subunit UvrC [Clostridia bacterium]|nr:excinuclease ABC subunit UvrC [Clostridia bacterium]
MPITKEQLDMLPENPGVYIMKDKSGNIIYIGKAKSLKSRVKQYFHSTIHHPPKVRVMVKKIDDIEFILTDTEVEALILECNLIKEHRPKYNVMLKDDKSYPYIKITMNEEYPRIFLTRDLKKDGAKYFGPYTNVSAVRQTIDVIKKLFPIRTCKKKIEYGDKNGRPCLNYHIKQCMAPCQGKVSKNEYNDMIRHISLFLNGKYGELIDKMNQEMVQASKNMNFEKAAVIRDKIESVMQVMERQKIISNDFEDQDVIACAVEDVHVCIQLFFIRNGKLIGTKHFMLEDICQTDIAEVLSSFIKQFYSDAIFIPKYILLQSDISEAEVISKWLTDKRGDKVYIKVPLKGRKKELIELVKKNAQQTLEDFLEKRQWELQRTHGAVRELKQSLSLNNLPTRIEAFDISNIQGTQSVGSMVVFEDGRPVKKDYRRFRIKTVEGTDDFASIAEIIQRRYKNLDKDGKKPDLILIDGGKGQLNAALSALKRLGWTDIDIIGLAEKFDEIYFPDKKEPVILPKKSHGLHLIQRIRDEAHRFAITYHRSLRSKNTVKSILDDVPGVGPKRKKLLIKHFGSLDKIRDASIDELMEVDGINFNVAQNIYLFFHENY